MVRESEVFRTEGGPRLILELLVALFLVLAVASFLVVPALRAVAPDVFAGSVDYGRFRGLPDSPVEYVHIGFMLVTFGSYFYWRLYRTERGRQFVEAYREQY
jgi:hypothetical protein